MLMPLIAQIIKIILIGWYISSEDDLLIKINKIFWQVKSPALFQSYLVCLISYKTNLKLETAHTTFLFYLF